MAEGVGVGSVLDGLYRDYRVDMLVCVGAHFVNQGSPVGV